VGGSFGAVEVLSANKFEGFKAQTKDAERSSRLRIFTAARICGIERAIKGVEQNFALQTELFVTWKFSRFSGPYDVPHCTWLR
jgi:hypothetical protein